MRRALGAHSLAKRNVVPRWVKSVGEHRVEILEKLVRDSRYLPANGRLYAQVQPIPGIPSGWVPPAQGPAGGFSTSMLSRSFATRWVYFRVVAKEAWPIHF